MAHTYFLHLAYNGTNYSGWQRQPNTPTVQQTIEEKLTSIFKKSMTVWGCGRTDAGVHASQYVLHFYTDETISFDLKFILNKQLPKDITVFDVLEMPEEAHAMYDAQLRTYDYYIHLEQDSFLHQFSAFYPLPHLDFEAMKQAVALLTSHTEYRSFCKQPDIYKHTRCQVSNAQLFINPNQNRLRLTITANRFIRGMIRFIVAFVLQVGKNELTLAQFEKLLTNELEFKVKHPALPNGLYLSKIEYPYVNFAPQSSIIRLLNNELH